MVKYFLDRKGVKTRRLAGKPGEGHFEIASDVLTDMGHKLTPEDDLYKQMFAYGFVRVAEVGNDIFVEAPRPMTKAQKDFCLEKQLEGHSVTVNNLEFSESKDPRNGTKAIHA